MTAGRRTEEDIRPGRTATIATAAAATATAGKENGTGPPSSATFVWTLPQTLSSVCADTCSGRRRDRGGGSSGVWRCLGLFTLTGLIVLPYVRPHLISAGVIRKQNDIKRLCFVWDSGGFCEPHWKKKKKKKRLNFFHSLIM